LKGGKGGGISTTTQIPAPITLGEVGEEKKPMKPLDSSHIAHSDEIQKGRELKEGGKWTLIATNVNP